MQNHIGWKRGGWYAIAVGGIVVAFITAARIGRSDAPGLSITHLSNNVFQVAITNPTVGVRYQIQRRDSLSPTNQWYWLIGGASNQTSFVTDEKIFLSGFFQALTCLDCDNDGVNGDQDGNDSDPNIHQLAVTIDDPANGSSIP